MTRKLLILLCTLGTSGAFAGEISIAPDVLGVAVGGFTDPTFPPPMISGFEAYGPAWAMNASALPMPHHEYDGTSHGGPRA